MSYFRVSTASADVPLNDLGYTLVHPAINEVLSDQFDVEDLQNSEDLKAAIAGGSLTAQVNLDGTWTAVAAGDFDKKDIPGAMENIYEIVNTVDNQRLVNGADCSSATELHHHDTSYFTKDELGATTSPTGASLIGADDTAWGGDITFDDVQEFIDNVYTYIETEVDLDKVYDNDADGIMNVDGSSKDLDLRSDNSNDIKISRTDTTNIQDVLQFDVSADELILGALASGALNAVDVRVKTNLVVDGNITFTGTITDTTVNEMNVTNSSIRLRENATAVPGADAWIEVERGTSGNDAQMYWNETTDRWQAGLEGSLNTIALLEVNEVVTGIWEFQGGGATDPNYYMTQKTSAPTTNLGTANQIPMAMINGQLATYDKTNSRDKWLSVSRQYVKFTSRDHLKTTNEYLRAGRFTSNKAGYRLNHDATLVGYSVQIASSETVDIRVRKNGNAANLTTIAIAAATGAHSVAENIDFDAGDQVQVYSEGTLVDRHLVVLEFANRFDAA